MVIKLLKTDEVLIYNGFKVGEIYPVVHRTEIFNSESGIRKCHLIKHYYKGRAKFITIYPHEFEQIN